MTKLKSTNELNEHRDSLKGACDPKRVSIVVCGGTGCLALGAEAVITAFLDVVKEHKLENIDIVVAGCPGFCERGPVVTISYGDAFKMITRRQGGGDDKLLNSMLKELTTKPTVVKFEGDFVSPKRIFYQRVTTKDVEEILSSISKDEVVERLLYSDPTSGKKIIYENEVPFYAKQKRIVLADNGRIDPTKISDYITSGGYSALSKVLTSMSPEDVIAEVKVSGLRGRGGAGFPTGLKWEFCRKAKGEVKYLICNADEGDPGAFMDRAVLEGNPHLVLEGMLIAAFSIGSKEGYVYVRAEYPLAIKNIKQAVAQAEELGLLGDNILGTDFSFHLKIKEGAGAFVCGEETALIASIEGKRGMPSPRPPFPAQSGLWKKPTNINNVETFANIRHIILEGGKEYAKLGTETSKGTKVFALSGKINNTGLVEVPMGTTLKDVIFEIGGGIPKGKKFKAVQLGGPSGGCLTTKDLDLPIDYENLVKAGAMMGSGGMVVMDEDNCMIEIARFFMEFTQSESCGKCTPCRIGTKRMLEILTRITEGQGREEDIDILIKMAKTIKDASLCGLGQTAPNPVLSTIANFRQEYEEHLKQKKCYAYVCEKLYTAPCSDTCPAHTEVYSYVALIAEERFDEALELIKEKNPFPSICGRICYHPCEAKCKRAEIDKPLALRMLKRFVSDRELELERVRPKPVKSRFARPEKVAVIGAGAAGLSCAYYLARRGYPVTVYETLEIPGGLLATGIPNYRFPKRILRAEIEDIVALGVEIKTKVEVGKDISFEEIRKEYNAVFIGVGAGPDKKTKIEGGDGKDVIPSLAFLQDVNLGTTVTLAERIVVIGGGFSAIDSARYARKLGALVVTLLYRRSKTETPISLEELAEAENEGVKMEFLTTPRKIIREEGRVVGIEALRMKQTDFFDENGKRVLAPIESSRFILPCDMVIVAIGQKMDANLFGVELTPQGTIKVDNETQATSLAGIFAGGDAVSGAATVIEAIAAGNRAGKGIDKYLSQGIDSEVISRKRRKAMPTMQTQEKKVVMEDGAEFTQGMAVKEARRCLKCYEKE